jgi:hypothetical protein
VTVSFIRPAKLKILRFQLEDFDKKKFKREYLGRIIDNVSYYPILFSSTVMCRFYFSSTVA